MINVHYLDTIKNSQNGHIRAHTTENLNRQFILKDIKMA